MSRFTENLATSFKIAFGKSPVQRMGSYPIGGNITHAYQSASYPMEERAFNTLATHFSKLKINYYYDDESKEYADVDNSLAKLLKHQPNKYQNVVEFWHSYFYMLYKYNVGIIVPEIEVKQDSSGYYNRTYKSLEVLDMQSVALGTTMSASGEKYLVINNLGIENGYQIVNYDDVVIMRAYPQSFYDNESYEIPRNDLPTIMDKSLSTLLAELESNFEVNGVVNIGNGSLGGVNGAMASDDAKRAKQDEIMNRVKNKLIVLDAGETFTPLQTNFRKNTIQDIEEIQNMYYNFFGIPKNIIDLTYTEQEFMPFVNSTIIPKIEALEYELNAKLLTSSARGQSHRISIAYSTIDAMSTKEFVNFTANGVYNAYLNKNWVLRAIGEKPIVGGSEYTGNRNMADMNGQLPKNQQGATNEPSNQPGNQTGNQTDNEEDTAN